ncbi:MAG TPA: hypothetical protein VFQ59_01250 [Candidatus Paceibacterota bacterium]|nr:hypothetical protein [Candidatus Paceibacterota bacterium]
MTLTWSLKRQLMFIGVFVLFLGTLGYMVISPIVNRLPTCEDGRQNGDEQGVDCGGSCALVCLYQVDQVSILWSRAFEVVPGRYNAVAYLENHNPTSAIRKIKYRFRFADEDNIYIGMREGETLVPPSAKFAVFEPALDFGNSAPVYVTFEFLETPVWVKAPEDRMRDINILVSEVTLENEATDPRLSAKIKNDSLFIVPDIDVVTLLYDENGNAISASRTYVEELKRGESKEITFTWPQGFKETIIAKEIIPMYDIFMANLK